MTEEIDLGRPRYPQEFRRKFSDLLAYRLDTKGRYVLVDRRNRPLELTPTTVAGCILGGVGVAYFLDALGYPEYAVFGGIGGFVAGGIIGKISDRRLARNSSS